IFRRLTKTLFKTYGVVSETIRLFSHHCSSGDGNETRRDPTGLVIEPCWLSVSFRPPGKTRTALVARQVPVPPRIHGRAGTAGTIARIAGENDPHGFPTCPTAFRDLRGLCFETRTDCPRSNRKSRSSPCPMPRSHGGIPVTGTASITRFPTILRDASPSNRRV